MLALTGRFYSWECARLGNGIRHRTRHQALQPQPPALEHGVVRASALEGGGEQERSDRGREDCHHLRASLDFAEMPAP
jgi:hypothetical protein